MKKKLYRERYYGNNNEQKETKVTEDVKKTKKTIKRGKKKND